MFGSFLEKENVLVWSLYIDVKYSSPLSSESSESSTRVIGLLLLFEGLDGKETVTFLVSLMLYSLLLSTLFQFRVTLVKSETKSFMEKLSVVANTLNDAVDAVLYIIMSFLICLYSDN